MVRWRLKKSYTKRTQPQKHSVPRNIMQFSSEFIKRLEKLGINPDIYSKRTQKAVQIFDSSIEEQLKTAFGVYPVPWSSECYFTEQANEIFREYPDKVFIKDPISCVPVIALEPGEKEVLDICAAPGSKTIDICQKAEWVVANDIDRNRIKRLRENVKRYNIRNITITNKDARFLKFKHNMNFDRILVDAPCSGEGIINKIEKTMKLWSLKRIQRLSRMQHQILTNAWSLLKPGGILVYSTCTFSPEENEAVISGLMKNNNAGLEEIKIKGLASSHSLTSWNGKQFHKDIKKCLRIYPQHNGTNGFFVAKVRKLII